MSYELKKLKFRAIPTLRADAPKNQKNQGYASERVSSNFLHFWFKDSPMEAMKFPQKFFCPDTPLSALRPGNFFR